MTRTVRILRIALPLLFVAFLILVIVSFTANERSDRVASDVASDLPRNEKPQRIGDKFALTQTVSGRTVLRIVADRTVGFESGWYTLEGVTLTVYRAGGRTYEISARQAQVHQETRELQAVGGVSLRSGDGVVVQTTALHFDGRQLVGRDPLSFRMGPWVGKAGGLILDVTAESVRLVNGVEGSRPPAQGQAAIEFKSGDAEYLRTAGELRLRGSVAIARGADRFNSDSAIARIDPQSETLRSIAGDGNAVLHLADAGATAGAGNAMTVNAARFDGSFDQAGQLEVMQAHGAPAVAKLAGPPERVIVAPAFRLQLTSGELRAVHATGGVRIVEAVPGGERRVEAQVASAVIDPGTGRASSVQASGNVAFIDPAVRGSGDRGTWDLTLRRIVITSEEPRLATARTSSEMLRARRFEIDLDAQVLNAHEQVYASMQSARSGGDAVFSAGMPVYVNSNVGVLRQREGIAVFRGNVRAWQGDDTLFADELRVVETEGVLTASGGVRTQLHDRGGEAASGPIRTVSEMLVARREARRIELDGNVSVEESGRIVTSDKAVVLVGEGGGLRRVEGTGDVRMKETATGRAGGGSRVVYQPAEKSIVLEGSPARISDVQGEVRGEQILFDLARNTVEVLSSGAEPTEATYNPPSK